MQHRKYLQRHQYLQHRKYLQRCKYLQRRKNLQRCKYLQRRKYLQRHKYLQRRKYLQRLEVLATSTCNIISKIKKCTQGAQKSAKKNTYDISNCNVVSLAPLLIQYCKYLQHCKHCEYLQRDKDLQHG